MTKTLLEQYPDICGELEEIERQHIFTAQRARLLAKKHAIEDFVASLPESRQRRVVMLRAMQGLTWQQVAGKMGTRYSVQNVKRIYYDTLKKYLESERK